MDIISFIITFVLAILMLYLIVRLPLAMMANLRAGHRFRQGLAEGLEKLRLARMLKYLGIDKAAYLHKEQGIEIKQHMERCDDCDAKNQCDDVLETQSKPNIDNLGFCANIDDLKKMHKPDVEQKSD